jgi:hypothetical protein
MYQCQGQYCNDDHQSLKNHKWDFLVRKLAVEAARKLGDAEARADEDCQDCNRQSCEALVNVVRALDVCHLPIMKALNILALLTLANLGSISKGCCLTLQAKSAQSNMNKSSEAT